MKTLMLTLLMVLAMVGTGFAEPSGDAKSDNGVPIGGGAVSTDTVDAINPETGAAVKAVVISTGTNPDAAAQAVLQAP